MTLPSGSLSFGLGTTRLAGTQPSVTGSLNWSYQLPIATLAAQINRSITYTNANVEQLQTSVSLAYSQAIGARSNLIVNASYSLSDPAGALNNTANTSLAASYGLAVTPDWNLNVGYTRTMLDKDGIGKSDSNLVFVGLQRTFNLRP